MQERSLSKRENIRREELTGNWTHQTIAQQFFGRGLHSG